MKWLKNRWLNYFLFSGVAIHGMAQQLPISDSILHFEWSASWIAPSEKPLTGYGIFVFRKTISLSQIPPSFIIHVSADNRYKLFVNGKMVSTGPARGDIRHWILRRSILLLFFNRVSMQLLRLFGTKAITDRKRSCL